MFTWECPKCGKELDVDAQSCPKCGEQFGVPETAEQIAPPPQRPAPAPPATPPTTQAAAPAPTKPEPPAPAVARPTAPPPAPAPQPSVAPQFTPREAVPSATPHVPLPLTPPTAPAVEPAATGIQGKHLLAVVAVLIIAIGGAVYLARPDLFGGGSKLQLEEVPESDEIGLAAAAFGDLQVAGIRPFYTDDVKAKVRVVIINHGETAQSHVRLVAQLSPKAAPLTSPPLAKFMIELEEELGPQQSREIEADLLTLGTLASFPPWKELRIALEAE